MTEPWIRERTNVYMDADRGMDGRLVCDRVALRAVHMRGARYGGLCLG